MTPRTQTVEVFRFFDGGTDDEPAAPEREAAYELTRHLTDRAEGFQLRRRIGYLRRVPQGAPDVMVMVPHDLVKWRTDFASIPPYFAWLVPRSGDHLPAAIVHDAILEGEYSYLVGRTIYRPGSPGPNATLMPQIPRDEADSIMKEAMGDLGTGVVRRWLIWTAVTLATLWTRKTGDKAEWRRWYYFVVLIVTTGAIATLGAWTTANAMESAGIDVWGWIPRLWWLRSPSWPGLIVQGIAGAIVVPVLLSALWGRFWRAGLIAGVALAALLHVTVVLGFLTAAYELLERLAGKAHGQVLLGALLAAVAIAFTIFLVALIGSR